MIKILLNSPQPPDPTDKPQDDVVERVTTTLGNTIMRSSQAPVEAQIAAIKQSQIEAKKNAKIAAIQDQLEQVKRQFSFMENYEKTVTKVIELLDQADKEEKLSDETRTQLQAYYDSLSNLAAPDNFPPELTQAVIATSKMIKKEITHQCIERPLSQLSQQELHMKFTSRLEELQEKTSRDYQTWRFERKKIITLQDIQEINSTTRQITKTAISDQIYPLRWKQERMEVVIALLQEGYDTKIEQYIARICGNKRFSSVLRVLDSFLGYLQNPSFVRLPYGDGLSELNKTYIDRYLFKPVDDEIPVKNEREEKTYPGTSSNTGMFAPMTDSEKIARYTEEVSVLNEVLKKHKIEIKVNPPSKSNDKAINAVHFRVCMPEDLALHLEKYPIAKLFLTEKFIAEEDKNIPQLKFGLGYFYAVERAKLSPEKILSLTKEILTQFPDERLAQKVGV